MKAVDKSLKWRSKDNNQILNGKYKLLLIASIIYHLPKSYFGL